MKLLPLDTPPLIHLVAEWLGRAENARWLDVGEGRPRMTPEWIKIAGQRGTHVLRVFTADDEETPIGVVALNEVNRTSRTANLWVVLGERAWGGRGYASRAVSKMLTLGFVELGLHAINTWIVDGNPSVHVARHVHFRPIGRQRQCHLLDGELRDRLWFDLLASEHKEI